MISKLHFEPVRPSIGVLATALNRIVLVFGPLLLVPLFIRYFQAEDYGVWITVLSITSYFGLLNLGIAQVVLNVVMRDHSRGELSSAAPTIATAFGLYLFICAVAWVISSGVLLTVFAFGTTHRLDTLLTFWITVSCFLGALPTQLFLGALRGCKRVVEEQMIVAGSTLVRYAGTAAGLLIGLKLPGIALIHGLTGLVPGWIAFWRVRRVQPELRISMRDFDGVLVGSIVRQSSWFVVLQVSGLLVWGIDTVVIAWFLGPAEVPSFAVPMQIVIALQAVASIVTNASTPHLIGLISTDRRDEARRLYIDLLTLSAIAAAVSCVGIWIGGRAALEAWAGTVVVPNFETMIAMGVLLAIQCLLLPADSVLVGTMHQRGYAKASVVEGVVNLALSIWWVNVLGVFGVILATIVARIATNGWYLKVRVSQIISVSATEEIKVLALAFALPIAAGLTVARFICNWNASCNVLLAAAGAILIAAALATALNPLVIRRLFQS